MADGLGRLGRAVNANLQRLSDGKDQIEVMRAMEAFRRYELGRLDKIGAGSEVGEGFRDDFTAGHAVRRDKTIARLEKERPGAAPLFAEQAETRTA